MKWHEAPLLPLAAALAVGIVVAAWAAVAPVWLLAAGGLLLAVGACSTALGQEAAATAALLALSVTVGALRGATEPLPADHIARAELGPVVHVEGRLAESRCAGHPTGRDSSSTSTASSTGPIDGRRRGAFR